MEFMVTSISCHHCVNAVTHAIKQHDIDADIQIDLLTKIVAVNSQLEKQTLLEIIHNAGYDDAIIK